MIAAVVLTNSLVHLRLVGDPRDTTNLLLFMVGAGFLLLSTPWLLACLAITIAGWVLVANGHPPFEPWGRFLFALVSAAVLSLLVHIVRLRTVLGFEQLRAELERLVTERTRTLAAERNLLRTLVDNLPDGVFVKDTAGRYRLANAAAGTGAALLGSPAPLRREPRSSRPAPRSAFSPCREISVSPPPRPI